MKSSAITTLEPKNSREAKRIAEIEAKIDSFISKTHSELTATYREECRGILTQVIRTPQTILNIEETVEETLLHHLLLRSGKLTKSLSLTTTGMNAEFSYDLTRIVQNNPIFEVFDLSQKEGLEMYFMYRNLTSEQHKEFYQLFKEQYPQMKVKYSGWTYIFKIADFYNYIVRDMLHHEALQEHLKRERLLKRFFSFSWNPHYCAETNLMRLFSVKKTSPQRSEAKEILKKIKNNSTRKIFRYFLDNRDSALFSPRTRERMEFAIQQLKPHYLDILKKETNSTPSDALHLFQKNMNNLIERKEKTDARHSHYQEIIKKLAELTKIVSSLILKDPLIYTQFFESLLLQCFPFLDFKQIKLFTLRNIQDDILFAIQVLSMPLSSFSSHIVGKKLLPKSETQEKLVLNLLRIQFFGNVRSMTIPIEDLRYISLTPAFSLPTLKILYLISPSIEMSQEDFSNIIPQIINQFPNLEEIIIPKELGLILSLEDRKKLDRRRSFAMVSSIPFHLFAPEVQSFVRAVQAERPSP